MRVSARWLAEWVDVPDSVLELADALTMGGVEVEAALRSGPDLSGIRVGHVVESGPHPNADRLSLCAVDLGEAEPIEVVCGAPNVAAGQKVAVATPPCRLPDGSKLKKSKIRGVVSMGMICSPRELGLSDEHEGILVLDSAAVPGQPLDRVISAGDTQLEIAIMPNRGDCASLLGIAREVRAHFGGPLRQPPCDPPEAEREAAADIRIEIDDVAGCYRYDARVIRGVHIGASPAWLRAKLEAAGLRAINNVVDVANLVMLEFGQPLHSFDLDRIQGGVVRVRSARDGEILETLDGEKRPLQAEDLVIADADRALAVAGVMGGADSEVTARTQNVLIESAHFHPARIRRTARRLGLSSDASYRFERNLDRLGTLRAADRAARLIAELAGGQVSRGFASAEGDPAPHCPAIALHPDRLNRLLGTALDAAQIAELLERLEIHSQPTGDGGLDCRIPSHRNDLWRPEDLIEEVARIHGYHRIPTTRQSGELVAGSTPDWWVPSDRARDALRAEGLIEVASFPFVGAVDLDRLALPGDDPRRRTIRVLNPLVERESQLRSTLLPSLLRLARDNLNRQASRVGLFELSRVFRKVESDGLPDEPLWLTAVLARGEVRRLWEADPVPLFFEAKGIAERLLAALGYAARIRSRGLEPYLHPGASAVIDVGKVSVGHLGLIHPKVRANFEIDADCAVIELDLRTLLGVPKRSLRYLEVSRHPCVRRDLAVVLNRTRAGADVADAIRRTGGKNLRAVEVFDRYEGSGIPKDRLSLAFRLEFQRSDRTLTDAEVSKSVDRIVSMLREQFDAELR